MENIKNVCTCSNPKFTVDGQEHLVCLLDKGIYGLKQEAHTWYEELHNILKKCGFIWSKADPCLYIKIVKNKRIVLIVYVNNFLLAAEDITEINQVINLLKAHFELKNLGLLKYYLGIEITTKDKNNYCLIQNNLYSTFFSH